MKALQMYSWLSYKSCVVCAVQCTVLDSLLIVEKYTDECCGDQALNFLVPALTYVHDQNNKICEYKLT